MRGMASFLSVFLCSAMILAPGTLSYGAETNPQAAPAEMAPTISTGVGLVERPADVKGPRLLRPPDLKPQLTELPPGRPVQVPPGQKLLVVPADMPQGPVMGPLGIPGSPDGRMVWVEAVFAELDRRVTRDFEGTVGFNLSPPDGKAILTAEEKEKVLAAIQETESARVVASLSVLTIAGQQAQSEHVEELTYPTEFKYEEGKINPDNWETRDVGAILNVTPTICEDARIALVMLPEVTTLSEWKKIDGTEVTQPIFATWNMTTTVIIPDGSAFILKEVKPVYGSKTTNPESASASEAQITRLLIVSAKVVDTK